jgi:hypothetical protein
MTLILGPVAWPALFPQPLRSPTIRIDRETLMEMVPVVLMILSAVVGGLTTLLWLFPAR